MTRQEHLLVILAEECSEIQQQVCKALRFGIDDVYTPESPETNAESIIREIGNFMGILGMLQAELILPTKNWSGAKEAKRIKIEKYLEYSEHKGTLGEQVTCPSNCKQGRKHYECSFWHVYPHGCADCTDYNRSE